MRKIDCMLIRMITRSKGQFFAVLTIVTLGIAFYTSLNLAVDNLEETRERYYGESDFADVFTELSAAPDSVVSKVAELSGVDLAEGRLSMDVPFLSDDPDERVNVRVLSSRGEDQRINSLRLEAGRMILDPGKDALVLSQFAEAREIETGDEIRLYINGSQYQFTVCGIVSSAEFIYLMESEQTIMPSPETFGVVYLGEAMARQVMGLTGAFNEILILCEQGFQEGRGQDELVEEVERLLDPFGLKRIVKAQDQLSNNVVQQEIDQFNRMCVMVPALFLMVAGLVLIMMLSRMVKRDRIKIGILKAIGYSDGQVIGHYVKYAAAAGLAGGLLGAALGVGLANGISSLLVEFFAMPHYDAAFDLKFAAGAVLLSLAACAASGVVGAREAARIHPAESMKAEAPRSGKRIFLERFRFFWRRLPFSGKLVLKNVFRSKRRSAFVLAGVTLTYALALMTMTMPDVIDEMMVKHYTEFQTMDYNISFSLPVTKRAVNDFHYLFPDAYAEAKIEYPFDISIGNRTKTASIIGLEQDTEFYRLVDRDGVRFTPQKNSLLLTENLAAALEAAEGDYVRVSSYVTDEDVHMRVDGIVKQSLGMNGYMEISSMAEMFLEKNAINGVFLNTEDPEVARKLRAADKVSTIASTADMKAVYDEYMGLMNMAIGFMVIMSGVLGFCIVYNTTTVSLEERETEFSSLRVLGFGKNQIFRMIVNENIIITAAGILLGIPVGAAMLSAMSTAFTTDIYTMVVEPTIRSMTMAAGLTVLFILLAELAVYRKITGLDFLQALKNRVS